MKSIKFILFMIVGLSSTGIALAQQEFTLKEALNYAIQNNETVRKAKLDIEGGKYKTEEIRANALPQINGFGGLTYNPIIGQLVAGDVTFKMGRAWNTQAGVQLDQQLFNQQVFTGLKAAKASEEYYALNANLSEEQIIEATANNYYQVLVNREQLEVVETNIKNVKVVEKIIDDQFKNGLAKKIDADRIKVNLANLETQKQQLKNAIEQLEIRLKLSMGLAIETPIVLPPSELTEISSTFLTNIEETNLRTELKILNTQEHLLGLQKKAYEAEYYPTLALTGNYSYTGMSEKFDLFKNNSEAFWYDASAVGLTLKVPIFSGFRTRSKVKQAQIDISKLNEDIKYTKNALNAEQENANIQLRNSLATINLQKKNVALAKEIYNSTQNNYNNGLASLTDLLDTENAQTQAQNSYNQAILNYKIAEIQLIKSNGNIKTLLN